MSEKDYLKEALEHWKGLAEWVGDSSRLPPIGTIVTLIFQGKRVAETLSVGALDKTDDAWTLELMDPVRRLDQCLNPTNIPWGYRERKIAIVNRWPAGTLRAITRLRRALDGVMVAMRWSGDETADGMPRFPKMVYAQGRITEEWITATDKADHPTAESFEEQFRVNTRTLQAEMEWVIKQEKAKAGAGKGTPDKTNSASATPGEVINQDSPKPKKKKKKRGGRKKKYDAKKDEKVVRDWEIGKRSMQKKEYVKKRESLTLRELNKTLARDRMRKKTK